MRRSDFESMVRGMTKELPSEYFDGVVAVDVSPKTVPHPTRPEIFTLGECIPLPTGPDAGEEGVQSRIVLYHGSFQELARVEAGFDWRGEAWETLTHELRHHIEWRARRGDLEAFDQAAEQNFARLDGEPFDPLFYLDGELVAPGWYQVDDDRFLDLNVREIPATVEFAWHGSAYRLPVPAGTTLPVFLTVEGVEDPPPGELVVVLRKPPRFWDLFRRSPPPTHLVVQATAEG
jgi:hypothetical protein